jgi:hypothetical protein
VVPEDIPSQGSLGRSGSHNLGRGFFFDSPTAGVAATGMVPVELRKLSGPGQPHEWPELLLLANQLAVSLKQQAGLFREIMQQTAASPRFESW